MISQDHRNQSTILLLSLNFFTGRIASFPATTNHPPQTNPTPFPILAIHKLLTHFVSTVPKSLLPLMPQQISSHTKHRATHAHHIILCILALLVVPGATHCPGSDRSNIALHKKLRNQYSSVRRGPEWLVDMANAEPRQASLKVLPH